MKKVLILYTEAGGGHKSNATAVANKIKKDYADRVEVELFNPLDSNRAVKRVVERGYVTVVNKARPLWNAFYLLMKQQTSIKAAYGLMKAANYRILEKKVVEMQPHIIISTYYFGGLAEEIVTRNRLDVQVFTIITDPWGFPPIWLVGEKHQVITFSDEAYNQAISMYPRDQVKKFGPIINEKYDSEMNREEKAKFAAEIGIDPAKKTVIITGGGMGLPQGDRFFEKLLLYIAENRLDWQVIIVCGNNEKLYQQCRKIQEKYDVKSLVFGFVTTMFELLNVSDILITKAGPATLLEAIKLKKKLVVTDYIWEQEKFNVDFIEHHGCGVYLDNVDDVSLIFERLNLEEANLEIQNGLKDIVDYIVEGCQKELRL